MTNNNIQNSLHRCDRRRHDRQRRRSAVRAVDATIQNNTIGTAGVAGSGSVQGNGIFVDSNGNGHVRTLITGNAIRQWTNRSGIALDVLDGDAEMSATLRGNLLTEPNSAFAGTSTRGMTIQLGTAQAGDSIDACLDIGHASDDALKNHFTGTGESPQPDVRYLHEGLPAAWSSSPATPARPADHDGHRQLRCAARTLGARLVAASATPRRTPTSLTPARLSVPLAPHRALSDGRARSSASCG